MHAFWTPQQRLADPPTGVPVGDCQQWLARHIPRSSHQLPESLQVQKKLEGRLTGKFFMIQETVESQRYITYNTVEIIKLKIYVSFAIRPNLCKYINEMYIHGLHCMPNALMASYRAQ